MHNLVHRDNSKRQRIKAYLNNVAVLTLIYKMSTTDNNDEEQCGNSGEMTLNKEKCTCEQSNVNNITEGITSIAILDDKSVCANCGKKGNDVNNVCNKCKMVKYCNAACKKKHRHKHKKDCEEHVRLAAERAAELHDIELFKQPPADDCSICFLRMPTLDSGWRYKACCGKVICSGCSYAPVYDNQGNEVEIEKCAFCRVPTSKSIEEAREREKKRVEAGDAVAMYHIGVYYRDGIDGFPQNYNKALELWHRAGELGEAKAYTNIGFAYKYGKGVEVDEKKAKHYYELAAMQGNEVARHNLGSMEACSDNMDRALKHYMMAVMGGYAESLKCIKDLFSRGYATKDDYTKALQLYQAYLGEIKSDQRDKAAAADEDYRYY